MEHELIQNQSEYFETVPITDFRPLIALHYTDMSTGVMDYYLREAAIRFARKTKVLRRTIHIEFQQGVNEYIISGSLPDSVIIHEISEVRVDGCCFEPVCDRCHCQHGRYKYYSGKLKVCSDKACHVEVDAIVMPSRSTCRIDADIAERWGDVIAHGANAKLMMSNDKRWKNREMARQEEVSFLRGVEEALNYMQRGGVTDKVWYAPTNSDYQGYEVHTGSHSTASRNTLGPAYTAGR